MEATGVYWKPVWNIVSDGKFELLVANARHIKNVPGRKTDMNDAMWIADLVSFGLIKASFVPEQEMRNHRRLIGHQRSCRPNKTPALPLEQRGKSCPYHTVGRRSPPTTG
jgi:transposase